MRLILDTNIWISYLLTHDEATTIRQLVNACIAPIHTLIMPPETIQELQNSIVKYPYLGKRIPQRLVDALIQELNEVALHPDSLQVELTQYGRDPQDDYLIAYGLIYQADYLVTGDQDLLVLGTVEQLQIVSPADARSVLEEQGMWPNKL
jgi:putative PIN family toxin of toxin-antitoxin system